jgi:hypothetical protein
MSMANLFNSYLKTSIISLTDLFDLFITLCVVGGLHGREGLNFATTPFELFVVPLFVLLSFFCNLHGTWMFIDLS